MKWIGLTGSLGTGKSTVTKILRSRGFTVLDADQLAHEALQPGKPSFDQVLQDFGHDLLGADGSIDRKRLAALVFGRPDQLVRLEAIIHPFVRARVAAERARLSGSGSKVLFYDVPLLFEKKMQNDFDEVWVVNCSEDLQRSRLMKGRGWSGDEINRRLKHQLPLSEKVREADVVIENSGTEADLLRAVEATLLSRGIT